MAIVFVATEIATDPVQLAATVAKIERYPALSPLFASVRHLEGDLYRLRLSVAPLIGIGLDVRRTPLAGGGLVLAGSALRPEWFALRHELLVEATPHGARLVQTMRFTGLSQKVFPDTLMHPIQAGCTALGEALRDELEYPSAQSA